MGFSDLDVTYIQKMTTLTGGSVMEYGAFSANDTQSHSVPTTLKTLISGVACGSTGYGHATSITGDNVDVSFPGAATEHFSYIFFGW